MQAPDPGVHFDIVVSGINRGANTGLDVTYSGTVAGAREGDINGIIGIGLHSLTSQLKLSAFYGMGGACKACVAHVKGVLRGV